MNELINEEAKILSRNYSDARKLSKKWKLYTKVEKTDNLIQWVKEKDDLVVLISQNSSTVDAYKSKSLFKRQNLRRNENLLKKVLDFWETINPNHLPGISTKVYKKLYLTIYSQILKDVDDELLPKMVKQDSLIDFNNKTFAGFNDFYDGLFEFIDCNTKSSLLWEYWNFANSLCIIVDDIRWGGNVNIFSKVHIEIPFKQFYHSWMVEIIKAKKKTNEGVLPVMLKSSNQVKVSERLLMKKKVKSLDKNNFNIRKLEKVMSEKLVKTFKPEVFRTGSKNFVKENPKDRKGTTFYSNYIEKISPLSSMIKNSRPKNNILEYVIDGRKTTNNKQKIDNNILARL